MSIFESPKPCPKCGSEFVDVDHGDFDDGNDCEFVRCADCEYEVKRRFAGNGVAYWNKLKRDKMPKQEDLPE